MPELVDRGNLARDGTLGHIDRALHHVGPADVIRDGRGVNLDEADTRVLWSTIVLVVTEVTQPGLEGW